LKTKPKSIEKMGLQNYLLQTAEIHNGLAYLDFIAMIDRSATKVEMFTAFGVNRKTMDKWIIIYERENNVSKKRT